MFEGVEQPFGNLKQVSTANGGTMSIPRILYIDIDSLRPDHLSCYGYPRKTSPNIDKIAADGVVFDNCFVSDMPCAPSRSSMFTGRFGVHNGVVSHSGPGADPIIDSEQRRQGGTELFQNTLPACLRRGRVSHGNFQFLCCAAPTLRLACRFSGDLRSGRERA